LINLVCNCLSVNKSWRDLFSEEHSIRVVTTGASYPYKTLNGVLPKEE
jgi:hypothetical protein